MHNRLWRFLYVFAFINSIVSLTTWQVHAAGEVIPNLQTKDEIDQYSIAIRRQLPFGSDVSRTITLQLNGLPQLRMKFPEYDKWMQEKPDPLTFEVFKSTTEKSSTPQLRPEIHQYVQSILNQLFQNEVSQLPKGQAQELQIQLLRERALANVSEALFDLKTPSRGLFIGLATLLSQSEKDAYFKLGDIQQQLQFLEKLQITDQQIRTSKLRAESVGLNQTEITYTQVLEIARQRAHAVNKVFIAISYLMALEKTENLNSLAQLEASDFIFALKGTNPITNHVLELLNSYKTSSQKSKENHYSDWLSNFHESFSRLQFSFETHEVVHKEIFGTVYEVHPHLGVHRGCIGGDCSTSNSPMFPYSPWEHVFYIKNKDGAFVGYVTATRVVSEKTSSLYIKDISGPTLSAELAEAVLFGFNTVIAHYGVKQILIATPTFTDSQNHFETLRTMLRKYNRSDRRVPVDFIDNDIRNFIGKNESIFASTLVYDNAELHKQAVVFPNETPFANLVFISRKGTLPTLEPKTYSELILEALQHMNSDRSMRYENFPWLSRQDLLLALTMIRNERRLILSEYYEQMKQYFSRLGFVFNRSFQEKYASLFEIGFLTAPDTFTSPDKNLVAEVERSWIRMAKLHNDYNSFMPKALNNLSTLQNSARFQDLISLYQSRLQPHDVLQLVLFAANGHKDSIAIIHDPKNKSALENAFYYFLSNQDSHASLANFISANNPSSLNLTMPRLSDGRVKGTLELMGLIQPGLRLFNLDIERLNRNGKLANALDHILIQANDAFHPRQSSENIKRLKSLIKSNSLNRLELIAIGKQIRDFNFKLDNAEIDSIIELHIRKLKPAEIESDLFELSILQLLGFKSAQEALRSPKIRPLYLKLLEKSSSNDINAFSPEIQYAYANMPNIRNFMPISAIRTALRLLSAIDHRTKMKNADLILADMQQNLHITPEEFLAIPSLAKELSKFWVKIEDAFSSSDNASIRFSLNIVYEACIRGTLDAAAWNRMLNQIKYLSQKKDFQFFVEKLTHAFIERNCDACAVGLLQIQMLGYAKKIQWTPQIIQRLVSHESNNILVYGADLAIQTKMPLVLSDGQLERIATQAEQPGISTSPLLRDKFQEMALKVLTHTTSQSAKTQKILLSIIRNEPINILALKAGLAYIAHGGSAYVARISLTKHFAREELNENLDQTQTALYKRFLLETKPTFGSGTFYGLSCDFLFVRR